MRSPGRFMAFVVSNWITLTFTWQDDKYLSEGWIWEKNYILIENLRSYRLTSMQFPCFKISHLRPTDGAETFHLILLIEWMDIWNALNKSIQSFALGKNFHSLALGFSDLISSRALVSVVTQEMHVGMSAMPVYYRRNVMAGTPRVGNTLLLLGVVD